MSHGPAHAAEARRQQLLLQVLWRRQPPEALAAACQGAPARVARGLAAYTANAAAMAERVLAGVYPVLARAAGPEAVAVLARQAWRRMPPLCGDLDAWDALGEGLPALIAEAPPLADRPWLPDLARLEWAVHQAERAADAAGAAAGPPAGLDGLAAPDAPARRLQLRPGTVLLPLRWPVAALWQRAQALPGQESGQPSGQASGLAPGQACGQAPVPPCAPEPGTRPAPPAAATPANNPATTSATDAPAAPEATLVLRQGWRATVQVLGPGDAAFTAAVLAGQPLGAALDAAQAATPPTPGGWSFEAWLLRALREGWITAVQA